MKLDYNKNKETTCIKHLQANNICFIARKSDKCRLRSAPQTLNPSTILKTTTINKKAGIYRYASRECDIPKLPFSGSGCSDIWILRVF